MISDRKIKKLKINPKRFFSDSRYISWMIPEDWKIEESHVHNSIKIEMDLKHDSKNIDKKKQEESIKTPWLMDINLNESEKVVAKFKKLPVEKREVILLNTIENDKSINSEILGRLNKVFSKKHSLVYINYDRSTPCILDTSIASVIKKDVVWTKDWFKGSSKYILVNPVEDFLIFPFVADPFIEAQLIITKRGSIEFFLTHHRKLRRVFAHISLRDELDETKVNNIEYFSNENDLERIVAVASALDSVNDVSDDITVINNSKIDINPELDKGYDIAVHIDRKKLRLEDCRCFVDVVNNLFANEFVIVCKWSLLSKYERLILNKNYSEFLLNAVQNGAKVDVVYR